MGFWSSPIIAPSSQMEAEPPRPSPEVETGGKGEGDAEFCTS